MTATYRLQLTPEFGFDEVRAVLGYLKRLGVSHLYLSPITEAVPGSNHGYDVTDHNSVRAEFGGREGFERLREEAVRFGLKLILDIVPNHAGVGPGNEAWQDLLAHGPNSPHAETFDVDWDPLEPSLRGRLLLPFLGRPYGEVLDDGEIALAFAGGYFYAAYFDNRFRLSPASYSRVLTPLLAKTERQEGYFDLLELRDLYGELQAHERERAEALRGRLTDVLARFDLESGLASYEQAELHALLEEQFWRLAYWKTAADQINYRRFFDVNGLVALRMDNPRVFLDRHQLLSELVLEEGVAGVRVDHIDGLVDPRSYLESLKSLGPQGIWVEKILAAGETLPDGWPVSGTTGYEFMNDALRLLMNPAGEEEILRTYRRLLDGYTPYHEEVVRSKRLIMETSLAGELTRLANMLRKLSEADYHTRDFTTNAILDALADVIACFDRYRTYLPDDEEEAATVLRQAVSEAKRRALNVETSVYEFILTNLTTPRTDSIEEMRRSFVGRFQQYTAPVAAKGVEDTAFYRFVPMVALNEVGGEPDHFSVEPKAFHSRARYRQRSFPRNLLATATHDHKRGEDTRMRLAALSELARKWAEVVDRLDERAQRYWLEQGPLGSRRISQQDAYLFYQHLVALWPEETRPRLIERLQEYMRKAMREAKQISSWINPDAGYEDAVQEFVANMVADEEVSRIIEPLSNELARLGFLNGISQMMLKLTTPGVPDIYQGSELLDLSLVDPDNRNPVDFEQRTALLDQFDAITDPEEHLREWLRRSDPRLKMFLLHRMLQCRLGHPDLFEGGYRPIETETESLEDGAGRLVAYARESVGERLLVILPRYHEDLDVERLPNLALPDDLRGNWLDVVSGRELTLAGALRPAELPLLPAALLSRSGGGSDD